MTKTYLAIVLCLITVSCDEAPQVRSENSSVDSPVKRSDTKVAQKDESAKAGEVSDPVNESTNSSVIDRNRLMAKRGAVVGKLFQTLTIGGRQYSGATVKEINDVGVKIQYKSGIVIVDWKNTADHVREAWGYDESAYTRYKKKKKTEQVLAAKKTSEQPGVAIPKESSADKEQRIDQKRNSLSSEIGKIEAEISRGTIMLGSFENTLKSSQEKFAEEDRAKAAMKAARSGEDDGVVSTTIGGVSTSKADRNKKMEGEQTRVINAKLALDRLKLKLKALETALENL